MGARDAPTGREPASGTLGALARYDALALLAAVWFLAKLLRYALPPLFGTIRDGYGVSTAVVGGTYSAVMLAYAATQFPSGALADRVGGARVVAGGAGVAAVGALVLAVPAGGLAAVGPGGGARVVAGSAAVAVPILGGALPGAYLGFVGGAVLFGVGTGAHKTVSVSLVSRTYPRRVGRALGAFDTVGAVGGVVAPIAVVALLPDWRALYLGGGAATAALAAAVVARVPRRAPGGGADPDPDPDPDPDAVDGAVDEGRDGDGRTDARDARDARGGAAATGGVRAYLAPLRDPRVAVFALSAVLFSFATGGVLAFLPLFLETVAGLSTALAGTLYGAVFAGSVAQLATGELGDRVGYLPVAAATAATATVGLAVVAAAPPLPALAAGVLLVGVGVHGLIPVRGAYLMAALPESVAGGGLGVVRTAFMTGGAVAPAAVGVAAEAVGLAPVIAALAAGAGLSVAGVGALLIAGDGS